MHPYLRMASQAAQEAGIVLARGARRLQLSGSDRRDSDARTREARLVAEKTILSFFPYEEHLVLGRETGLIEPEDGREARYKWLIDGLNGAENYVNGLPHYAVTFICYEDGVPVHALIYDPLRVETFSSSRGSGAFLENRRLRVLPSGRLSEKPVGAASERPSGFGQELFSGLEGFEIRVSGSSALDLAHVAAGYLGAFKGLQLSPWGMAAGAFLVRESGGLVSDFAGGNDYVSKGMLIAGSSERHAELIKRCL